MVAYDRGELADERRTSSQAFGGVTAEYLAERRRRIQAWKRARGPDV